MVGDIAPVAAQWHPENPGSPQTVPATAQAVGQTSPYRWLCPMGLGHPPWEAWPKDRIQKGAGCRTCRMAMLAQIPTLVAQYAGETPAGQIPSGTRDEVPWVCRTWAVEPATGDWRPVEHRFDAGVHGRVQQGDGCLVCAGYRIDETTSLSTWFPELAEQLADPSLDPRTMSTSIHNLSKKALEASTSGERYADVDWICRHGHRWRATVANRVQGTDCRQCSTTGISKEQVRLAAELATVMTLVAPPLPDPRLPLGLPNLASHHFTIPQALTPPGWRYKKVEVDCVFTLEHLSLTVGLEYDGAFHHSDKLRERGSFEREKDRVLVEAEFVDLVIHVRVGDLPVHESPHALVVCVAEGSTAYEQARAVALAVETRLPGAIPRLPEYLASARPHAAAVADAYIEAVWGELRPPRPRPTRTVPKPRQLRETSPHRDSLLTPIGPPRRSPEDPEEIVRDYVCRCKTEVTRVQSQVTSGNTRSCGCLQTQDRRRLRAPVSMQECQQARAWAHENGVPVNGAGRVPDRVVASWRLAIAGRGDQLGDDMLMDESPVRQWAVDAGLAFGARNRMKGEMWLEYAELILKAENSTPGL